MKSEIEVYLNAQYQTERFLGNVMVTQGGEVLFAQGYGRANLEHDVANQIQTKFRLGSITKQFTAAAILQLQEQGLLNVQNAISTYLPDYPNANAITIHHLLTHTSAIPNLTNFPDYKHWMRLPTTLEELIARFKDLPLEFEPGERFNYSNSGYILLTKIIEKVSGQSYADYVEEKIFQPLGMNNTGYETPLKIIEHLAKGYQLTDDGYRKAHSIDMSVPQGAGGLYSTVEDLVIWNRALYEGNRILSDESISAMTTPIVPMIPDENLDRFYGYGLVIDRHLERQRIGHGGSINGFSTALMKYPDENLTVVVLSNLETATPGVIAQDLAAIVLGESYELPSMPEVAEIDSAIYERYIGDYQLRPKLQISIMAESAQLRVQVTGQEPITLYPASESEFFAKVLDLRIRFEVADDGTVRGFTLRQGGQEIFAPRVDQVS